jgi:hypothetical protein
MQTEFLAFVYRRVSIHSVHSGFPVFDDLARFGCVLVGRNFFFIDRKRFCYPSLLDLQGTSFATLEWIKGVGLFGCT